MYPPIEPYDCGHLEVGDSHAVWPVPAAERDPGHRGGRRHCRGPAPDPARCLPRGHLAAGLPQQHARVEARFKGEIFIFSAESIIVPVRPP